MGVYIRGIEMPKSCESCPCKTAEAFGGLGCQATGYIPLRKVNQGRPDNCPLAPVPPHGRLGDLDAAVEKLKKLREYHLDDSQSGVFIAAGISQCIEVLTGKDAPTIIPAEEGE